MELIGLSHRTLASIARIPKVFIAEIAGHALGGGLEIALACDLRFGAEISDVTDLLAATEFKAFRGVVDGGGVVRGLAVPGAMEFSRKDFDDLVEFAKGWGGKGVAWLQLQAGGEIRSPIAKFLSQDELAAIVERCGAAEGDTIFLVADAEEAAVRVLGPLRLHLGERLGLISDGWQFVWVTGFPMFEWLPDEVQVRNRKHSEHP